MKRYIKSAVINPMNEDLASRKEIAKGIASEDTLYQLAEDANQYTRVNIAKNPNTPPDLLTKLATDRSNKVKIAVAGNPNTPSDVLCSIVPNYGDIVDDTRYLDALLKNSNTPLKYRKQLVDAAYNYRHRYPQDSRYIEILKKLVTKKHTPKELVRYIENQEIELLEYWREKMPERSG